MKKTTRVLATVFAIIAIILSVLPLYSIAIFPLIAAVICLVIAYTLSKKSGEVAKIIQFTLFLVLISAGLIIYKAGFNKTEEIKETKEMVEKEAESKKEAIEELEDLDLEDLELE